jgi:allophanate hydrolase
MESLITAAAAVEEFLTARVVVDRPEVWIHQVAAEDLRASAAEVDARRAAGESLPLAGRLVAVKDNIDVAGCPTTAGASSYRYHPRRDATAVARLRAAGAVIVGKTNLDQFATGLVGTRSPFGAVRHATDPSRISGGSSSGSAVAVALGLVDLALGTDTAGSGRVPAALHGLWGVKPTRGLVPTTGVVPACWSLDCVTVFAREAALAQLAATVMSGPDGFDPTSQRSRRPAVRIPGPVRVIVPTAAELDGLAPGWAEAFSATVQAAAAVGIEVVERSIEPLLAAAKMLYGTSFVAERYAAVGAHIEAHQELVGTDLDPTVSAIVLAGRQFSAAQLFDDQRRLADFGAICAELLADATAVLTPTTTWHPTIAEVVADPIGANSAMGRFTNYANLLDLAAIAFPAGTVNGLPFGAMLTGPAFSDDLLAAVAESISATVQGRTAAGSTTELTQLGVDVVELFVVGAHRRAQPLNHQLIAAGAEFVAEVRTAGNYRLYALDTVPAKPGLVRQASGGGSVLGEIWRMPVAGFGAFVAAVPAPMVIGAVELADGSRLSGFLCEPIAITSAEDITEVGDWVRWLSLGSR